MSCQLDLKAAIAFRQLCIRTNKVWFQELDTADKATELEGSKEKDDINYNTTKKTEVLDPLLNEETIKVENQSLQLEAELRDSSNQQLDGVTELSTKKPKKRGRPTKGQSESVVIRLPEKKSQKEATRRKWARAKRIHAKEQGLYICSNFNVHLTRHTGLKQLECEECGRKEFTLHLLKLHVRIKHRGELPYTCKYCGQRFDNCIKRLRHERGHKESTVHRPCAICKKAFKDKIALRFHAVVHTGEQAFHCEL
ncbi:transcription factor Ouib-like isoform X2 [Drosophila serrata]|nr:transcription factor Ouib-like isoform X2 [Drosophila serrata]